MHATAWDWKRINTAVDKNSDCSLTAPLVKSFLEHLNISCALSLNTEQIIARV